MCCQFINYDPCDIGVPGCAAIDYYMHPSKALKSWALYCDDFRLF